MLCVLLIAGVSLLKLDADHLSPDSKHEIADWATMYERAGVSQIASEITRQSYASLQATVDSAEKLLADDSPQSISDGGAVRSALSAYLSTLRPILEQHKDTVDNIDDIDVPKRAKVNRELALATNGLLEQMQPLQEMLKVTSDGPTVAPSNDLAIADLERQIQSNNAESQRLENDRLARERALKEAAMQDYNDKLANATPVVVLSSTQEGELSVSKVAKGTLDGMKVGGHLKSDNTLYEVVLIGKGEFAGASTPYVFVESVDVDPPYVMAKLIERPQ